jgi:hypothetical protein
VIGLDSVLGGRKEKARAEISRISPRLSKRTDKAKRQP